MVKVLECLFHSVTEITACFFHSRLIQVGVVRDDGLFEFYYVIELPISILLLQLLSAAVETCDAHKKSFIQSKGHLRQQDPFLFWLLAYLLLLRGQSI